MILNKYSEALASYDKAIAINPDNADALEQSWKRIK